MDATGNRFAAAAARSGDRHMLPSGTGQQHLLAKPKRSR